MTRAYLLIIFLFFCAPILGQRNVIIIIADDLGADYCGFQDTKVDTANFPNVRRLLKRGVNFKNAWSNPLCSPTRAGILTGRYSFRTGVGDAIGGIGSNVLDTAEVTIPKLLQKFKPNGIAKGLIGKWHLQSPTPKTNYIFPNKMGFDHFEGSFPGQLTNYSNWIKISNGSESTSTQYATSANTNDAINFIQTNKNKPFFLWLAYNAGHTPYHLPPNNLHSYKTLSGTDSDIASNPKLYYKAMLEAMDKEIGRLFDTLQVNNIWENTDIVFLGDNGDDKLVSQTPWTPSKGSIYEGGVHVPLIISGPSIKEGNRTSNSMVHTTDLFATILDLFGNADWAKQISISKPVDSKSILPILKNTANEIRSFNFTEVFKSTTGNSAYVDIDSKTIKNNTYKYLYFSDGTKKLFNIIKDPTEKTNLYSKNLSGEDLLQYNSLCSELGKLLNSNAYCETILANKIELKSSEVYPNPFSTKINLKILDKSQECILYNSYGQTIYEGKYLGQQDFSYLSKGLYFLLILGDSKNIIKLVKE